MRNYYHKLNTFIFYTGLFPEPRVYYQQEFPNLKQVNKDWVSVNCCFHEDKTPSLRLNVVTGAFRCFSCGARGGNIIAFQCQHYHQSFREAVEALGNKNGGQLQP